MSVLSDELTQDPLIRGYNGPGAANSGPGPMTDQEAADDLNTEYRTRNRDTMTSTEVWQAIDIPELQALADGDRSLVMAVLQFDEINPFGNEATLFIALFGAGSNTIIALNAARIEAVSRAIELGLGRVRTGDVARAWAA